MRKSTSLLLAGLTVLGLSGFTACDNNNAVDMQSININNLEGYKVSGTGSLFGSEIDSIMFCPVYTFNDFVGTYFYRDYDVPSSPYDGDTNTSYSSNPDYLSTGFFEVVNNNVLYLDDVSGHLETDTGTLDVGTTYDEWTITSIEEAECPPPMIEI